MTLLLVIQTAATLVMCGIAWFVQVVHYPLFARVGAEGYTAYQGEHLRRTTFVVFPPMIIELTCAAALIVWHPTSVPVAAFIDFSNVSRACLGARKPKGGRVLAIVAWNMVEKHAVAALLRHSRGGAAILLATFGLTVFRDLIEGIAAGCLIAAALSFAERRRSR